MRLPCPLTVIAMAIGGAMPWARGIAGRVGSCPVRSGREASLDCDCG